MNRCKLCSKKTNNAKYCSNQCQADRQYLNYLYKWFSNLLPKRAVLSGHQCRYIYDKYHHKCHKCGWHKINKVTGKSPLEINHIDGDATNNCESNLELLCPNCHSLTPTYKALNIGNGKRKR